MNKILTLGLITLMVSVSSFAQFKSKVDAAAPVSESLLKPGGSDAWLGLLDFSKLSMRHSYSLSYLNVGGKGLSLGMLTSSLMYKFSDVLDLQTDISLMHSPYNSFGNKNDLSGIFLNRAELNYRPTDNLWFQLQFRQVPPMYWLNNSRSQNFFYGIDRYEDQR
jgi:hypothetical protein